MVCGGRGAVRADPDVRVEGGRVVGPDVARAVLEAHQIPGRHLFGSGGRGAAEAQLGPAQGGRAAGRPGEVADGMEDHLRIVRAGLDAQVAVGQFRPQDGVAGDGAERGQLGRSTVGQAEPVVEQAGTETDGDGQRMGAEVHRLAGVERWLLRLGRRVADLLALGHPGGHRRPAAQHAPEFLDIGGGDVERGEHQPFLLGCGDARLAGTVERHHVVRDGRHLGGHRLGHGVRVGDAAHAVAGGEPGGRPHACRGGPGEEPPPGGALLRHVRAIPVTAPILTA